LTNFQTMDNIQPTEIESLNNPQEVENLETNLTEEKETISQEPPLKDGEEKLTDGENQETPEPEIPAEPEKTPEQIAEEEAKKKFEADLRAERIKHAKTEQKLYNFELSKTVENEFRQDPEKATVNLIKDKNKFERVVSILAQDNPAWRNQNGQPLSHDEFVNTVKQLTSENAKQDPTAIQTISKIEQASQEATFRERQETEQIFTQVKYDIMLDMPEFLAKARNPQTAQLADGDLTEALNLAGARINRIRQAGGDEPDALELTKEYLRALNPEWGQSKALSTTAKTQAKQAVNNMLKDSVTSNTTQSTAVTNLTANQRESREAFINFLMEGGDSKEVAIAKANQADWSLI
jgi:hypothetical protein